MSITATTYQLVSPQDILKQEKHTGPYQQIKIALKKYTFDMLSLQHFISRHIQAWRLPQVYQYIGSVDGRDMEENIGKIGHSAPTTK